jgi:hypothetical protein
MSAEGTGEPLPLAYDASATPNLAERIGVDAVGRGWHEVSAMELGIAPADYGMYTSGLRYSFVDGFYQAEGLTGGRTTPTDVSITVGSSTTFLDASAAEQDAL